MEVDQTGLRDDMGKLLSVNLLQRIVVALAGIPLLLWAIVIFFHNHQFQFM